MNDTAATDWTRYAMAGGTAHDMTDIQCRVRFSPAPINPEAVCAPCSTHNSEHREFRARA